MMKSPLISIVVVNYNYGRFIKNALDSIFNEIDKYKLEDDIEVIFVDGGSNDDSLSIIEPYKTRFSWWCSEKDKGQSDAFNKGFSHARGKYLTWLNSDDAFIPGALNYVVKYLIKHPAIEWLFGGIVHADSEMRVIDCRIGATPPCYAEPFISMTAVSNPSTFFTRERFNQIGGVDVDLHYIMDMDLWRKFFRAGMKCVHINKYIWAFRMHEESKTAMYPGRKELKPRDLQERQILINRFKLDTKAIRIGDKIWWLYKALSGSFARSYIDSKKYIGRDIHTL